jgi:translation initiation factor IF-1
MASVIAEVVEILPSVVYRLKLADGREVLGHLASQPARGFVRLRLRDRVEVELSAADPARGRIVKVLAK